MHDKRAPLVSRIVLTLAVVFGLAVVATRIVAGKTHGKNEATLGRLAQGASGMSNRGKP
jgi:hypothetical protein